MSDGLGECLGELLVNVVGRAILTGAVIVIDKQIVQRRDVVIRWGRQFQNWFPLPEWMFIFAENDPGMPDTDMRIPWALGFMVVGPGCIAGLVWLVLILSKRCLRSRILAMEDGHCRAALSKGQPGQQDQNERNLGLEASTRSVWVG
ncbi:hypothetical protein QBC33DRAFT_520574 [Phialemonium atrogriseum]|uniref:Uncharacterized protein n=1 Tax=Phialemonium atrogriseum TaxID=1093897 RepID=A0AAJ0FRA5_9PEZI|nr:uncharacterized protein QBC33DRAFT_520574 [Phialemonium atrogriseum]KAK1772214.1 hypothetical protein QBC33DRAFT_520574 [Phialemonium atrogriseum]